MINTKSQNGITIISLILTIVLISIISVTVFVNFSSSQKGSARNKMYADLKLLEEKVLLYYNNYGDIPKKSTIQINDVTSNITQERNVNDNNIYYEIDYSKLDNITLYFGKGNDDDKYIINEKTLTIYYLKGIDDNGQQIHRYPYNYSEINS